ncbi:MAG: Flp pilus assembly protein CpaB [Pseudomonadota bacterium]
MKRGQLIGIGVAGVAALIAFVGMQSIVNRQPETIVKQQTIDTVDVLVARTQLNLGDIANASHLNWKKWPKDAVSAGYITRASQPRAMQELAGGVARSIIMDGEPITEAKLVHPGKGGVLSAILPKGKRAVSTEISDITAAGRLILPNDHVDVMLTHEERGEGGREFSTETIFRNVRVLAIGKKINVKDKEKGADGRVATLELTSLQAEELARANEMGKISLALRSIADINETEQVSERSIRVFRGATVTSYGSN